MSKLRKEGIFLTKERISELLETEPESRYELIDTIFSYINNGDIPSNPFLKEEFKRYQKYIDEGIKNREFSKKILNNIKIKEHKTKRKEVMSKMLNDYSIKNKQKLTEAEEHFKNILDEIGIDYEMQYPIICKLKENKEFFYVGYIADFLIDGIVYEIDGGYHNTGEQKYKDKIRDERLERLGYKTIRYTNEEVMQMSITNNCFNKKNKNNGNTIIQDKMVEELGVMNSYLLSRLIRWKNYKGVNDFSVSDKVLMDECHVSKNTFRTHRDKLVEEGYVTYKSEKNEDGSNKPSIYQLNFEKISRFFTTDKSESKSA